MAQPQGLWRGTVTQVVDGNTVKVQVSGFGDSPFKAEQLPEPLMAGDRVLVGFAQGRANYIEIVRKLL